MRRSDYEETQEPCAGFNNPVAVEAVKGERTVSELVDEYGVYPAVAEHIVRLLHARIS